MALPCDITPPTIDDQVVLILWYKDEQVRLTENERKLSQQNKTPDKIIISGEKKQAPHTSFKCGLYSLHLINLLMFSACLLLLLYCKKRGRGEGRRGEGFLKKLFRCAAKISSRLAFLMKLKEKLVINL